MEIISFISDNIVWGAPTLGLMLFSGVFFTFRSKFFQIRKFPEILKKTIFSREKSENTKKVSPFEAMCHSLAATLGTGNIAGVGAALATGGAGSVFWMWVCAVFGMMTGFAENVLGFLYRKKNRGGAMYYIEDGLKKRKKLKKAARPAAILYAALCTAAGFGMGAAVQMNSAAQSIKIAFGAPAAVTGIVLAATAAAVILGGKKRISAFCAKIVPIMSLVYIIGTLFIIFSNIGALPRAIKSIFEGAFGIKAVGGGIFGAGVKSAVTTGFKRGAFSNEAGLGTSVFAHADSGIKSAAECGMWSVFEIFFDTVVMCTLTAAALLTAKCALPCADEALSQIKPGVCYFRLSDSEGLLSDGIETGGEQHGTTIFGEKITIIGKKCCTYANIAEINAKFDENKLVSAEITPLSGAGLANFAFSGTFGKFAGGILGILTALFAFSTVVGWAHFTAEAACYIFGERVKKPVCAAFVMISALGAAVDMYSVWAVSDLFNGLMALPNLLAVLALRKEVLREIDNYEQTKNIP